MEKDCHHGVICIDDSIAAFCNFELTKSAAHLVRSGLISAGFVMNEDKSDFILKTKEKQLGVIIDTMNLIFMFAKEEIVKLKSTM